MDVTFPSAERISELLGVNVKKFHKDIKPVIKKDFAKEMKKINSTNPDIGVDGNGNVVLKNPKTGKTILTGVPINLYEEF